MARTILTCGFFELATDMLQLTIDRTGETPWVLEMIKKHHDTAKENKAIVRYQMQASNPRVNCKSNRIPRSSRKSA